MKEPEQVYVTCVLGKQAQEYFSAGILWRAIVFFLPFSFQFHLLIKHNLFSILILIFIF